MSQRGELEDGGVKERGVSREERWKEGTFKIRV
jgi:hypothetical protein